MRNKFCTTDLRLSSRGKRGKENTERERIVGTPVKEKRGQEEGIYLKKKKNLICRLYARSVRTRCVYDVSSV